MVIVNPTAPVGPGDHAPTPTGRIITDFLAGRMPAYVEHRPQPGGRARTWRRATDWRSSAAGAAGATSSGNENLTLRQILQILAGLAGRRAPRVRLPHALAIAVAAVDETIEGRLLGREPMAPLDGALMARKRMFVDGSRAVRELGMPQSPVRAALADAIDWFAGRRAA